MEGKRTSRPLRKKVSTAFSIKKKIQTEEVSLEEKSLREDLPRDVFSMEDVLNSWNNFLMSLKNNNNIPVYNALFSANIRMEGRNIIFSFASLSSAAEFENCKQDILKELRGQLNNYYFDLQFEVSEEEQKNYILSKKEKFAILANKNKLVIKLKNELGLDLFD